MSLKYNELKLLSFYISNQEYFYFLLRSFKNHIKRLDTIYDQNKNETVNDMSDEIVNNTRRRTRVIINVSRFKHNGKKVYHAFRTNID